MKTIKLGNGMSVKVDDEDFEYLNQFKWQYFKNAHNNNFYARRIVYLKGNKKTRKIRMHREILGLTDKNPKILVDHINHDGLDNRKINLRICNSSENAANSLKRKSNKSGYKGVHWNKKHKQYYAQIVVNRSKKHLGCFENPVEAAKAYDAAAVKYHGEFALVNFPLRAAA